MVNINKIQTALQGLVGFKQPFSPDYAIVDIDNQKSDSGYFVTDNSYAKIEYIKDNQDYEGISDLDFNLLLTQIKHSAVSSVMNQVFSSYDFIDRDLFYKNASNKIETESLVSGWVGYQLEVAATKNKAFKINRVLLDFQGTGAIELLLWNTSKKQPLLRKVIQITTDHQEVLLDWVIDNASDTYKGEYYIGYLTSGLTVQPYKREFNNGTVLSSFVDLNVSEYRVVNHNTTTLFDLNDLEGLSESTGLNFDISVYDDYTDFAINNKMLFARAMQLECIIYCIQMYMSSLRNNANNALSNVLYERMMIDLEGVATNRSITVKGLRNNLISEIVTIKEEIEKIRMGVSKKGMIMITTLR